MFRLAATLFASAAIALLFGVAGIAGLVHVYGADLPGEEELAQWRPKLLSRVYSGEGRVIAEYATERRLFVPIEEIPPLVRQAFNLAEDKNFYEHPGVDAVGIAKAAGRFAIDRYAGRSGRIAGASTITQQVMKNFLLTSDRSLERKVKEAILAVRLDGALTKDRILELYLNEIFFGQRAYGVAAAARIYYDKRLDQLAPHEAAYLAGLPKEPSNLHPVRQRRRAVARRNYVLREMRENGYLSKAAYEAARARPLDTVLDQGREEAVEGEGLGYFTAEVARQVSTELGRGELYEGGLTVRATVDPRLQRLAAKALRRGLVAYDRRQGVWRGPVARMEDLPEGRDPAALRAALAGVRAPRDIEGWHLAVVLDAGERAATIAVAGVPNDETVVSIELNGERWIKARLIDGERWGPPQRADQLWRPGDVVYVVEDDDPTQAAADWDLRQIPEVEGAFVAMDPETGRVLAIQGGFSYEQSVFNRATQAERQPGSLFKPFVYAAALDAGYTPATIVNDEPVSIRLANGERWEPKNSSGNAYGPTPLRRGLELSRNLMTVRIAQSIGMDRVGAYAERFGVYDDMPGHLAYALGAGETTLYEVVAAYGMFVNGGRRVQPSVIDRIQDRRGETIYAHDPRACEGCGDPQDLPALYDRRERIMDPATAFQLVSMLEGVVTRGTAASTVGGSGVALAGKTGTTNDARDAWFVGFSPKLVAGCFIGFDQPRSLGRRAYGGTLCGPVFKEFMAAAHEGEDPGGFEMPADAGLETALIDRRTGQRLPWGSSGPNVIAEVFKEGSVPVVYARAGGLASDAQLFGDDFVAGALPYALDDGNDGWGDPWEERRATTPSRGDRPTRPSRPQPSRGVGFGTGGLY
ncbi:MAG: penicillin-binding protein 1A [Paracoccaceae bacterium]